MPLRFEADALAAGRSLETPDRPPTSRPTITALIAAMKPPSVQPKMMTIVRS
jgi:hypothetical protein